MKRSLLSTYVAVVMALAAGLTAWLAGDYPLTDATAWIGVLMWTLAVGPQTVAFPRQRLQLTMSDCFIFYGILTYGPLGGITAAFVGTLGAIHFSERKPTRQQAAFNLGAVPLAAALAGLSFEALGSGTGTAARIAVAAAVFAAVNTLLVAVVQMLAGKGGLRNLVSLPVLAFLVSVFVTATAGTVLAGLAQAGPGDWMVAGVVIVCFLGGKIVETIRDRSERNASPAPLVAEPDTQPAT